MISIGVALRRASVTDPVEFGCIVFWVLGTEKLTQILSIDHCIIRVR